MLSKQISVVEIPDGLATKPGLGTLSLKRSPDTAAHHAAPLCPSRTRHSTQTVLGNDMRVTVAVAVCMPTVDPVNVAVLKGRDDAATSNNAGCVPAQVQ
jgi:hypothetical protein